MTVNPQAQTLLDAAVGGGLAPPRLRNWELSNCGLYSATRGPLTLRRPTSGMSRIFLPGSRRRSVRYYRPKGVNESAKLPMLLYFHGGGWMVGDIETHDESPDAANRGRFAANVDYRLAPENKFPAAIEDLGGNTMGHQRCGWIVHR